MSALTLLGTCILPGCQNPVIDDGDACQNCRATFGDFLRAPGTPTWRPDPETVARLRAQYDENVRRALAVLRERERTRHTPAPTTGGTDA